jgi:hypothetical protein
MRKQQTSAVKGLYGLADNKQLKALIGGVVGKIITVLEDSKKVIEAAEFKPNFDVFPTEDPLRVAVAKIVENTAFYFELTIFLPDFMDYFTHKDPEVKPLIKWCYEFSVRMDLYDAATDDIVEHGAQELLVIPRPTGYFNPNRKFNMKKMKQQEAFDAYHEAMEKKREKEKSETKPKPKKSGPKLSKTEL